MGAPRCVQTGQALFSQGSWNTCQGPDSRTQPENWNAHPGQVTSCAGSEDGRGPREGRGQGPELLKLPPPAGAQPGEMTE